MCIRDRTEGHGTVDEYFHLAMDVREGAQLCREHDPDHGSACTSTDNTAGRSRTIADQWSPPSAEA